MQWQRAAYWLSSTPMKVRVAETVSGLITPVGLGTTVRSNTKCRFLDYGGIHFHSVFFVYDRNMHPVGHAALSHILYTAGKYICICCTRKNNVLSVFLLINIFACKLFLLVITVYDGVDKWDDGGRDDV